MFSRMAQRRTMQDPVKAELLMRSFGISEKAIARALAEIEQSRSKRLASGEQCKAAALQDKR